jgi:hypothetical protein
LQVIPIPAATSTTDCSTPSAAAGATSARRSGGSGAGRAAANLSATRRLERKSKPFWWLTISAAGSAFRRQTWSSERTDSVTPVKSSSFCSSSLAWSAATESSPSS